MCDCLAINFEHDDVVSFCLLIVLLALRFFDFFVVLVWCSVCLELLWMFLEAVWSVAPKMLLPLLSLRRLMDEMVMGCVTTRHCVWCQLLLWCVLASGDSASTLLR